MKSNALIRKRQTFPTWSFRNIFVIISSALLFGEVFMTREELREEWERRIADFKAGGMTRVQWCKEHGESIYKLKYWLYKIERQKRNEINKTNWVSMIVEDEPASDSSDTLQIKIGQAIIEVKPDFNPALLEKVVKVLKTIC